MSADYTHEEVAKHHKEGDKWVIVNNEVIDISHFDHPGGQEVLAHKGGKDVTKAMDKVAAHHENMAEVHAAIEANVIGKIKLS